MVSDSKSIRYTHKTYYMHPAFKYLLDVKNIKKILLEKISTNVLTIIIFYLMLEWVIDHFYFYYSAFSFLHVYF